MRGKWRIIRFQSSTGKIPVSDFIDKLQPHSHAKIIEMIDVLSQRGNLVSMPYSKYLRDNLYELRIRGKQEVRIFYGFFGNKILLVHGFMKKTQKTPKKEIALARKRLNQSY